MLDKLNARRVMPGVRFLSFAHRLSYEALATFNQWRHNLYGTSCSMGIRRSCSIGGLFSPAEIIEVAHGLGRCSNL